MFNFFKKNNEGEISYIPLFDNLSENSNYYGVKILNFHFGRQTDYPEKDSRLIWSHNTRPIINKIREEAYGFDLPLDTEENALDALLKSKTIDSYASIWRTKDGFHGSLSYTNGSNKTEEVQTQNKFFDAVYCSLIRSAENVLDKLKEEK